MSWIEDEPVRGGYPAFEFLALSGLERMRAAVDGAMPAPPIHHLFGLTPVSISAGRMVFDMPTSPWLQTGRRVYFPARRRYWRTHL